MMIIPDNSKKMCYIDVITFFSYRFLAKFLDLLCWELAMLCFRFCRLLLLCELNVTGIMSEITKASS